MSEQNSKLGLTALTSLCIGSMIGSGLFALPQNVASTSGLIAVLIGWVITFFGMLFLTKVFQSLSTRCPELDVGVYAYAKAGLGDYLGFSSAWGYWISAWIGNVGYMIMLSSSLSIFFPIFTGGTNLPSLLLNSIVIWVVTLLCIRGIKTASAINTITTVAKIIPIIIFICIILYFFNFKTFTTDVWEIESLGSILTQIKNMMLITVWVFIGIEGANVFSSRAKNREDVSKATLLGFLIVFFVLFAVSALPFGVLSRSQIAGLNNPSTSPILTGVVGNWGGILMSIGLIISVIGAFLSWTLIAAEVPFVAGEKDGLFPKLFTIANSANSPSGSLIITALCQQIYLIIAHFYNSGYLATIKLSTSMILLPYLFSAVYALIISFSGTKYSIMEKNILIKDRVISLLAVVYGLWLIYASGFKYLLLSSILYMFGNIVFIYNKKSRQQKVFTQTELILSIIFTILGLMCAYALCNGLIDL